MISQAASDEKMFLVWMLLMAASAGVFLHAGIKFPWFVFFQKDSGLRPKDPPWNMRLAMILFSGLCIGLGIWPEPLYAILPFTVNYVPYTVPHVVNMLQLLLFSGLAFFLMLPMMKRTLTISLDVDWLYRKLLPVTAREFVRIFSPLDRFLRDTFKGWIKIIIQGVQRQNGPEGLLAQTEHAGHMAQWMVVLLAVYLVLNFL